ncbi:ATP-binding cassette sub- C member 8, partial [Mortierella polycephala]
MSIDKHPPAAIEQAGIISYITFNWIQPMLLHGRRHILTSEDLEQLSKNDRVQRLADLMLREWSREVESKKQACIHSEMKRPNFYKVLWRCFGLYACVPFLSGLMESACKIGEAVLLGYVIRFFDAPEMTLQNGMGYALGLFFLTLFRATVHHHNFFHVLRIGTWIRQGLISLMYRKCLTLSTSSSISTGTIVNMISNDLQPFENCAPFFMYILLGPLETIVVMYFLWKELGAACLAGLLALFLLMPVQALFSRRFSSIRAKTVHARDERIRTLSDVFSGIALVKLCAWEVPFQERVMMLRSIELGHIWKSNIMRAANMSIYFFFQALIALFAFVTYWLQGKALTADKVFVSLTLFNILRQTMTMFFPKALESMAEVRVSVKRITDFLLLPELKTLMNKLEADSDVREQQHPTNRPDKDGTLEHELKQHGLPEVLLEMKNASFSWTMDTDGKDVNLEISAQEKSGKARAVTRALGNIEEDIALATPKKAILNNVTMSLRRDELLAI